MKRYHYKESVGSKSMLTADGWPPECLECGGNGVDNERTHQPGRRRAHCRPCRTQQAEGTTMRKATQWRFIPTRFLGVTTSYHRVGTWPGANAVYLSGRVTVAFAAEC